MALFDEFDLNSDLAIDQISESSSDDEEVVSSDDETTNKFYRLLKPAHLASMLKQRAQGQIEKDLFCVIDVRDEDCLGGHIPGSVNHPSFIFEAEIDQMVETYRHYSMLVFHCTHSQIRGPRCASLFSERLEALFPDSVTSPKVFLLEGGFEGWICRYGSGNAALVEDYHASLWRDTLDGISPLKRMLYTRYDPDDE